MRRRRLFEFSDIAWCPAFIRTMTTDWLEASIRVLGSYDAFAPRLGEAMKRCGSSRILDLCSGASGPLPRIAGAVERAAGYPIDILLTDKFPNLPALEEARARGQGRLDFVGDPVDATSVPPGLEGFRTLFDALHHFSPEEARAIFADAVRARSGIAVCESTRRSLGGLLRVLVVPAAVLALTPFERALTIQRLLFTYVIPIAPVVVLWDAVVSSLRSYTEEELREMTRGLDEAGYTWEFGSAGGWWGTITFVVGTPGEEGAA